jgi:hypothetical protein
LTHGLISSSERYPITPSLGLHEASKEELSGTLFEVFGSDGEDKDKYNSEDSADSDDSPFALPSTERARRARQQLNADLKII